MKKLFLVDASNMFFRAYFAIPPMNAKDGLPTNALYGFLNMSIKLLRDLKPDYLVYCFDRKEPTFRSELYPEYKANRSEMPEDLALQMEYIKKLPELLGIKCIEKIGLEADDVIGTLAEMVAGEPVDVIIVSGDKDFAQLVNSKVSLYDSMKDKYCAEEDVKAKWGVQPSQFKDYLALVGDSSDNIPGVRGVGPKTAEKLLKQYSDLDEVYKNIEVIKPEGLKKKLSENKEMAYLSKQLVTILTKEDLNINVEELNLQPIRKQELLELFDRLNFKSFEKKLFNDSNDSRVKKSSTKIKSINFVVNSHSLEELDKQIEPYSDIWIYSDSRGVSLVYNNDQIAELGPPTEELGQLLESKHLNWQGYDLKKIARELVLHDINCSCDLMLAAYIVRSGKTLEFKELCEEYLSEQLPELPSIESVFQFLIELKPILDEKLKNQSGLDVYNKIELPLVPVLLDMELNGIKLNLQDLAEQSKVLEVELNKLEKQIYELTGQEFNISSPKQLSKVLFEDMGLPVIKKTKTGYSTNSDVLNKLAGEYPVCELILKYRESSKLKSTYVDSLPNLVNNKTGRIHSYFKQAVTATGRLSSQNPNLQNIPIRTEKGRMIRRAFIAPAGYKLLSLDYSQIELRILAHITEDPALCKAFENDLDIHSATASEVFNVPLKEVTSELRRKAKAVNFGIAYGQGAYGLSESLGISRSEAKEIIEKYFEKFKNVRAYMDSTIQQAREQGFVETIFGRRRYLDEFKSKNQMIVKFGERAAINAPIQGAASDLVKLAMIEVHQAIKSKILLQVHDELLLECHEDKVNSEALKVKKIMENIVVLKVPLKVNYASGDNWEDAHG